MKSVHRIGWGVLIITITLGFASTVGAQQRSRIRGTVVDRDGNPVPGAKVVAENPSSMPAHLEKKTDKKGHFAFNAVQVGQWKIQIRADGFIPHEAVIHVGANKNVQTEIVLEKAEGAALLATSGKAQAEIEEARRKFEAGDYEGAIALYQELLEKAPEVYQIHFNLGMAYEKVEDYDKAAEHFRVFLEHEPDHFDANFSLANALSRTGGRDEAVRYYEKCSELQPRNAVTHFNLGLALFQSDRLDEAEKAFERCLAADPGFADAHFMLGNIHLRNKDAAGARESYEKFLELAPDSPNAEAARQALEKLEVSP